MIGNAGNDVFVVGDSLDVVIEGADGGIDTVVAYVDVAELKNVENILLGGVSALDARGDASSNALYGNQGGNYLDGGAGADLMVGGAGDDLYVVDNAGDTVVELADNQAAPTANAGVLNLDNTLSAGFFNSYGHAGFSGTSWGTDTVKASINYTLTANVENLTLTGSAAINGTGNDLANALTGNAGANVLDGGSGNDLLKGGGGNDSYRFGLGYGVDTILDKQGQNTLVFGSGIVAADLRFSLEGKNLLIDVTTNGIPTGDRVILQDWYVPEDERVGAQRVSAVRFASGLTVPLDETALNHAPTVINDAAALTEDTLRVGGNVLTNDSDSDEGNVLSVIGAGTYVGQYGTLVLAANGSYDYALRSGDADVQALQNGQSVHDTFAFAVTDNARFETATLPSSLAITVNGVNDAPIWARTIKTQTATEIVAFSLVLPVDTFTDVDAGDKRSVAFA